MKIKSKIDLKYVQEGDIVEIHDLDLGWIEVPYNIILFVEGKSRVYLKTVRKVQVSGESFVKVEGQTVAVLKELAEGIFFDEAQVFLAGKSRGRFFSSEVTLIEKSLGYLQGDSNAILFGESSAVLFSRSRAVLRDQSKAILRDKSYVSLCDKASAILYDWSLCDLESSEAKVESYGQSRIFRKTFKPRNKEEWLKWLNIKAEGEFIYLYKWVDENYRDFFSGTIDYSKDKIEAYDWNPSNEDECGKGLHLAIDPWTAFSFCSAREGRMLKFRVPLKDIYPYLKNNCHFPYKARVPKLEKFVAELRLENNEWKEIKGGPNEN